MDDAVRIAFASGLPYAGLRDHRPDEPLLAAVPLARRLGLLPLALHGHHLTLATPTPTPNLGDLPTHFHITLVISPAAEITAALARAETPPQSAARPEVAPPRPAARMEEPPPEPTARPEPPPSAPSPASRRDDVARRLGLAVVDHLQPDPAALARLDDTAQRRLRGVPLALDGDVLYVAIADRFGGYQPETGGGHVRYVVAEGGALDELLGSLHGDTWAEMTADSEPRRAKPAAPARPRDAEPPTTSLLLPLTGGVGATVHAATTLASLDHPAERLEVLLLVAAQDAIGARAAHALADGPGHRVITLPAQLPRDDRDAALHYGLLLARGEHVAVLDPGDIPAPGLLGAADHALAGPDVAAAQARLDPPAPSQRGPAWHRHAPLAATGVVVRRDVAEDLGGFRQLDRRLRRAGLRIAPLPETVATAGERS